MSFAVTDKLTVAFRSLTIHSPPRSSAAAVAPQEIHENLESLPFLAKDFDQKIAELKSRTLVFPFRSYTLHSTYDEYCQKVKECLGNDVTLLIRGSFATQMILDAAHSSHADDIDTHFFSPTDVTVQDVLIQLLIEKHLEHIRIKTTYKQKVVESNFIEFLTYQSVRVNHVEVPSKIEILSTIEWLSGKTLSYNDLIVIRGYLHNCQFSISKRLPVPILMELARSYIFQMDYGQITTHLLAQNPFIHCHSVQKGELHRITCKDTTGAMHDLLSIHNEKRPTERVLFEATSILLHDTVQIQASPQALHDKAHRLIRWIDHSYGDHRDWAQFCYWLTKKHRSVLADTQQILQQRFLDYCNSKNGKYVDCFCEIINDKIQKRSGVDVNFNFALIFNALTMLPEEQFSTSVVQEIWLKFEARIFVEGQVLDPCWKALAELLINQKIDYKVVQYHLQRLAYSYFLLPKEQRTGCQFTALITEHNCKKAIQLEVGDYSILFEWNPLEYFTQYARIGTRLGLSSSYDIDFESHLHKDPTVEPRAFFDLARDRILAHEVQEGFRLLLLSFSLENSKQTYFDLHRELSSLEITEKVKQIEILLRLNRSESNQIAFELLDSLEDKNLLVPLIEKMCSINIQIALQIAQKLDFQMSLLKKLGDQIIKTHDNLLFFELVRYASTLPDVPLYFYELVLGCFTTKQVDKAIDVTFIIWQERETSPFLIACKSYRNKDNYELATAKLLSCYLEPELPILKTLSICFLFELFSFCHPSLIDETLTTLFTASSSHDEVTGYLKRCKERNLSISAKNLWVTYCKQHVDDAYDLYTAGQAIDIWKEFSSKNDGPFLSTLAKKLYESDHVTIAEELRVSSLVDSEIVDSAKKRERMKALQEMGARCRVGNIFDFIDRIVSLALETDVDACKLVRELCENHFVQKGKRTKKTAKETARPALKELTNVQKFFRSHQEEFIKLCTNCLKTDLKFVKNYFAVMYTFLVNNAPTSIDEQFKKTILQAASSVVAIDHCPVLATQVIDFMLVGQSFPCTHTDIHLDLATVQAKCDTKDEKHFLAACESMGRVLRMQTQADHLDLFFTLFRNSREFTNENIHNALVIAFAFYQKFHSGKKDPIFLIPHCIEPHHKKLLKSVATMAVDRLEQRRYPIPVATSLQGKPQQQFHKALVERLLEGNEDEYCKQAKKLIFELEACPDFLSELQSKYIDAVIKLFFDRPFVSTTGCFEDAANDIVTFCCIKQGKNQFYDKELIEKLLDANTEKYCWIARLLIFDLKACPEYSQELQTKYFAAIMRLFLTPAFTQTARDALMLLEKASTAPCGYPPEKLERFHIDLLTWLRTSYLTYRINNCGSVDGVMSYFFIGYLDYMVTTYKINPAFIFKELVSAFVKLKVDSHYFPAFTENVGMDLMPEVIKSFVHLQTSDAAVEKFLLCVARMYISRIMICKLTNEDTLFELLSVFFCRDQFVNEESAAFHETHCDILLEQIKQIKPFALPRQLELLKNSIEKLILRNESYHKLRAFALVHHAHNIHLFFNDLDLLRWHNKLLKMFSTQTAFTSSGFSMVFVFIQVNFKIFLRNEIKKEEIISSLQLGDDALFQLATHFATISVTDAKERDAWFQLIFMMIEIYKRINYTAPRPSLAGAFFSRWFTLLIGRNDEISTLCLMWLAEHIDIFLIALSDSVLQALSNRPRVEMDPMKREYMCKKMTELAGQLASALH